MCGRYTSLGSPEELMRRFGVTITQNLRPRWNVAPSQKATVIALDGLHTEAMTVVWGLQAVGGKKAMLINARMETANEKSTFSGAFLHSRCIVVASGWYEWSGPKMPWYIQLRNGGVMAIAGLLLRRGADLRFVILTSAADRKFEKIHHRQPLVLATGDEERWLYGAPDRAASLCKIAPASWFKWHRVSIDVGKVGVDYPELVAPLESNELSPAKLDQGDLFS